MKKNFDLILRISFITYILVAYARPYITAQTWANIIFYVFLIAVLYQFSYILYLRKKEGIRFLESIANFLLYLSFTIYLFILSFYSFIFFSGYKSYVFMRMNCTTYYGIDAWKNALVETFAFILLIVICIIYQLCYLFISKRMNKKNKIDTYRR